MTHHAIKHGDHYGTSIDSDGGAVLVQLQRDGEQVRVRMSPAQARHFAAHLAAMADVTDGVDAAPNADTDLRWAATVVVRDALDDVEVHPCDHHNDMVRAQHLRAPLAALYSALRPADLLRQPDLQRRVMAWMHACFGVQITADKVERNHRFLEESLELVQACGTTPSEAHQLVDYVYGRPVGESVQEVGGVITTLAGLCNAQGIEMMGAGETELARVWTKVEVIRAKQAAKPKHSPLPESPKVLP